MRFTFRMIPVMTRSLTPIGFCSTLVLGLVMAGSVLAPPLAAQDAPPVLNGQVILSGQPLPQVMVTIHRVTLEESGPYDSLRAGPDGRFSFVLPASPTAESAHEVYFAAVSVDDVLYFGQPVATVQALDSLYIIETFPSDTVGATPPELPISVRNIFLEPTGQGDWAVTDLFEVRNDGVTTLVSDGNHPVFSYPLPAGATGFELGQSDLAADAVSFTGGALHVLAPIPPGERTYMIRYRLPNLNFTIPAPGFTAQFEVLAKEPVDLEVQGLTSQGSRELQPGQSFQHYLGNNLRGTQVVLAGSAGGTGGFSVEWLMVLTALVMGGVGVLAWHRGQGAPRMAEAGVPAGGVAGPAPDAPSPQRAALLIEIATLDEAFEGMENPTEEENQRYQAHREALTARLLGPGA